MPELPDVETFRKYVDFTSLHKKITDVLVENKKILDNISQTQLEKKLKNNKFICTYRHGKYLFIKTNEEGWLVIHFGMTGYLKYFRHKEDQPKHTRLLITFENGFHLAFNNQRLFGKIGFTFSVEQYLQDKNVGVDALDIKNITFENTLKKSKVKIKSMLMNQKLIAGIGNIYADEILFQSKIHPETRAADLNKNKLNNLFKRMKEVLNVAIDAKADPENFPSDYLMPHRYKKEVCPKGDEQLKTIKVNGRTTYYCPVHQKK